MKKKKRQSDEILICPKCVNEMTPVWENNGFNELGGPRKDEITGWECQYCGYTE